MSDGILIVTVTKVEAQAVLNTFSETAGKTWKRQPIGNKTYYELGVHGGVQVSMVQSEMGTATPGGALITVHNAIKDLHPQAVIMSGIAFGLRPDKQKLGDILVSRQIQHYEPQKIDFQKGKIPRGDRSMTSERLLDRFRSGDLDWQGANIHFGLVLSGEKLVNDPDFRDWLLQTEPEAIGGEMEATGLYTAARDSKTDWILVKAICDWADGNKNDGAQSLAAQNAAQFVLHVVNQGGWDKVRQSESHIHSRGLVPETQAKAKLLRDWGQSKLPTATYTVFISSPGDVTTERETAYKIIEEVNKHFRTMQDMIGNRIILDSLTWENNAFPNAGTPQSTIKKQIPYECCDIFIGIFWKRFGTPPGTVSPKDGKPYLSGTQQEIEEAMAHQEKDGLPIIMLYRKDEPFSMPSSSEEVEQFHRVTDFFRECEPGGRHPALIRRFNGETFGEVLRDHLFKVVNNLHQIIPSEKSHKTIPDVNLGKPERRRDDISLQLTDEITENLNVWLEEVKLREHPFPSLFAEYDSELPKYFARFQQIRALSKAEVFQDRNPWIFVGDLGTGKTALRKLLASWGDPINKKSNVLCLEFGKDDIQGTLSEIEHLDEFANHFLEVVHYRVIERQQKRDLSPPDWQPKRDLAGSLASLSQAVQECGLQRVMCLIDPDENHFVHSGKNVAPAALLEQLLELRSAPGGIGFCYFLPSDVKSHLNKVLYAPSKHFRIIQIQWTIDDLLGLISRRMITCSSDQLSPYTSLGQICDDERDFASLVDRKIATLAEGSPRGVIALAHHLIELHVQDSPRLPQMAPKTWDEVEMDWWWQRRRILPYPSFPLWIRGNHIFYRNCKLVLNDRSQRLLDRLVQDKENFASKDELKQAGWPGDSPNGVSDAALREALRRMKQELKSEFKKNELGNLLMVKAVRGQGYRLEELKTNITRGDKSDE